MVKPKTATPDPKVWSEAKAARDAEFEAAWNIEDIEERAVALRAAREAWAAAKAKLLGTR